MTLTYARDKLMREPVGFMKSAHGERSGDGHSSGACGMDDTR